MTPKPLIFLHIPKTGGTSLRSALQSVYPRVTGDRGRLPNGTWVPLGYSQLTASSWIGHMSFGMHTLLPEPTPYITIVRDPVARVISRFCGAQHYRERGLTPLTALNPEWNMTYLLSGIPQNQLHTLGPEHVELALRNLKEHFAFVGDTTEMDALGQWLKQSWGLPIELPLPHENKAERDIHATAAEVVELHDHPGIQLDKQLYARIRALGPRPQEWAL